MNGVHDMGGMDGFGRVVREPNEPVFHAEWEGRAFALASLSWRLAQANGDEFRHATERIPPTRYLASSYYERWLEGAETLVIEHGIATREELIAKQGVAIDPSPIANPVPPRGPSPVKERKPSSPRFAKGDRVRARNINPTGHTRLPRYARGKVGVVACDWGVFVFPDTNAHHAGTKPQHCYSVGFDARELWGKPAKANSRERVYVDLWEDYLEPIASKSKARVIKRRKR
jgi:nitrile hydratase subunit beta